MYYPCCNTVTNTDFPRTELLRQLTCSRNYDLLAGSIFQSDDLKAWQPTLDIDLRAVLVGTQLAARTMQVHKTRGTIISIASAAGIWCPEAVPVYCAAKGGLVHFTRSSGPALAKLGIHLGTVCPQFVETPLLEELPGKFRATIPSQLGPLLATSRVVEEVVKLAEDRSRCGAAVVMLQNGRVYDFDPVQKRGSSAGSGQRGAAATAPAAAMVPVGPLPQSYRAWQVQKLSRDFRQATALVKLQLPAAVPKGSVLIKRLITGVNASDVNFTSGVYHGSQAAAQAELPFVAGFESVGVVAKAGQGSGAIIALQHSTHSSLGRVYCTGRVYCRGGCSTVRCGRSVAWS